MVDENQKKHKGVQTAAFSIGNYVAVNKLFDEERFNASQGHGFAAERANDHIDRLTGHFAKITGDNNVANGPDRWVNGIYYQTKYYSSARGSVNAGFTNNGRGTYRYMKSFCRPMRLEVPSDQYEQAVKIMEEKILNGQVPGIKDPKKASDLVQKGHISYDQSVKIAKAGTIESIVYDSASGAVIGLAAGGISFTLTCALAMINGEDIDNAKKTAIKNGLEAGKRSAFTAVAASQIAKTGIERVLTPGSEAIAGALSAETSAAVVNAFRSGADIYGAAAMSSCAKLIRGNIISAAAAIGAFTAMDAVKFVKKEINGNQLMHRFAGNTTTVTAGTAGFVLGQAMIPIPFVGGLIGSFVAGTTAGYIVKDATDMAEKEVFEYGK